MRLQLSESARVVLNAAGGGIARVGPRAAGVRWDVRQVTVSSTSAAVPIAELFLGEPAPGASLGGTYDGNRDSTDVQVTLYSGQLLAVVWTGGDPGASATVSVLGDNVIGED